MSKRKTPNIALVRATIKSITPLLAGKDTDVQGAVLAHLVATWLVSHHRDHRILAFDVLVCTIGALEVDIEAAVFGKKGFPKDGRQ